MTNVTLSFLIFSVLILSPLTLSAAEPLPKAKLEACLKKANDLPDIAEAEAVSWLKHGGGEYARLCHASAQFNRNEFIDAAREFSVLAAMHDKNDPHHAAELHARSGLSYMRGGELKSAETEYAIALKLEPDDPEIWMDRATERAGAERYWDAISDLNRALSILPEMTDALRLRGDAWIKLGNVKNANADYSLAEQIDADDEGALAQPTVQPTVLPDAQAKVPNVPLKKN